MDDDVATRRLSIRKAAALVSMTGLLIWQGVLAQFVHQAHQLFSESGAPTKATLLVADIQVYIWLFMFFTVLAIYDISKRRQFLLLNSTALPATVALGNVFLHVLVVLAGYAPILQLGDVLSG